MTFALPPIEHVPTSGTAEEPFGELADILARVVAAQGGGGAALAVWRDGRPLVDLVAGEQRAEDLQSVFSVSKALTAIALARLHADGRLDLDAPIGDAWPEMAKASTAAITLRMAIAHRAGLPAVDAELDLDALAAGAEEDAIGHQEPFWEPGTRHGYHSFSFGTLVDGTLRRALGTSARELVRDEIATPLGAEAWLGLPEPLLPRVRPVRRPRRASTDRTAAWSSGMPPGQIARLSLTTDVYNDDRFRTAGFPASGGIASARGLAAVLAATLAPVDGVRLLDDAALAALVAPQAVGPDAVLGIPIAFGSGVQLPFPQMPLLGPTSFGHEAAGGSVALADRESGLAIGFTTDTFPPLMGQGVGFDTLLAAIRHLDRTASGGHP